MIERDSRLEAKHASTLHGAGAAVEPGEAPDLVTPAAEVEGNLDSPEAAPAKRPGHRFAWLAALVVMGALVGLVIVGFMKFVNGPVTATATTTLADAQATVMPKPTTNQLAGLYFDMVYPAIFDQVVHLKNDSQTLEQYNISSKKDYRRTMAISVRPLASNLVDDDASYKFRHIHPETYKERTDKLGGEKVTVMSKVDKSEVTLFWPHQAKLFTLSMTSSNPEDGLADYMAAVEPTLRWRQ